MDGRLLGCMYRGGAGAGDPSRAPVPLLISGFCVCTYSGPGQLVPAMRTRASRLRGRMCSFCPKQILH